MIVITALAFIGAVALIFKLLDSLWSVMEVSSSYLMPFFLPGEVQPLAKRFGNWAVVTGATDGIGKHYALELAKKGINVVIISRNSDKLKAVASEIEKEYNVKTKVAVADFSYGAAVYTHIEEEIQDIPVGILVNNVGSMYDYPMLFCEVPPTKLWELINVNVGAVTAMTRMVLPGMVARGRGAVVNVSSGSEVQPLPLMTVYAATKAYVASFTQAIREEYTSKGIYVQHLSPLFVSTKMNAYSKTLMDGNLFVPDPAAYSKSAVALLGRVRKTTGYWSHGIQYTIMSLSPPWINMKIGGVMNKQFRLEHDVNNERRVKSK